MIVIPLLMLLIVFVVWLVTSRPGPNDQRIYEAYMARGHEGANPDHQVIMAAYYRADFTLDDYLHYYKDTPEEIAEFYAYRNKFVSAHDARRQPSFKRR